MSHLIIPSINVLILDKDKILLSRRLNTGWMDGQLCIPGGHVEDDEMPKQAAVREMKEELDLDIAVDDLEFLAVLARNKKPVHYVGYEFILKANNLKYKNAEPGKCSELVWVSIDKLPKDIIEVFRDVIEKCLVGGSKYLETTY